MLGSCLFSSWCRCSSSISVLLLDVCWTRVWQSFELLLLLLAAVQRHGQKVGRLVCRSVDRDSRSVKSSERGSTRLVLSGTPVMSSEWCVPPFAGFSSGFGDGVCLRLRVWVSECVAHCALRHDGWLALRWALPSVHDNTENDVQAFSDAPIVPWASIWARQSSSRHRCCL